MLADHGLERDGHGPLDLRRRRRRGLGGDGGSGRRLGRGDRHRLHHLHRRRVLGRWRGLGRRRGLGGGRGWRRRRCACGFMHRRLATRFRRLRRGRGARRCVEFDRLGGDRSRRQVIGGAALIGLRRGHHRKIAEVDGLGRRHAGRERHRGRDRRCGFGRRHGLSRRRTGRHDLVEDIGEALLELAGIGGDGD